MHTPYLHEPQALATMRNGKRFILVVNNPEEVSFTNMVWRWGGCEVHFTAYHEFWFEWRCRSRDMNANNQTMICSATYRPDLFLSMRLLALRQVCGGAWPGAGAKK